MNKRKAHTRKVNGKIVPVKETYTTAISTPAIKPIISKGTLTTNIPDTGNWGDTRRLKEHRHLNTGLDEIPRYRSKKNTKKWCKGKQGIHHDFQEVLRKGIEIEEACKTHTCNHFWHFETKCVNCGMSGYHSDLEQKSEYRKEGDREMATELCSEGHSYRLQLVDSDEVEHGTKVPAIKTCEYCGKTEGAYKKISRDKANSLGLKI